MDIYYVPQKWENFIKTFNKPRPHKKEVLEDGSSNETGHNHKATALVLSSGVGLVAIGDSDIQDLYL